MTDRSAGSRLTRAAQWACGLEFEDLPSPVIRALRAQTMSTVGAALWTLVHPVGTSIVELGRQPGEPGADRSAVRRGTWSSVLTREPDEVCGTLSALSMAMDFDDTILGGHTGHSALLVPLVWGDALEASGRKVLVAQAAASEVAARLASAAAIGPFRGQQTAYLHGVAAAVGRGLLEEVDASTLTHAMALVLGQPPWPLTDAFLGSDAKIMTAAEPIRAGLRAVEQARRGLRGNRFLLEGKRGFLDTFSDYPLPGFFDTLGEQWHLPTLTVKVYPGCAYVTAAVHAALQVRDTLGGPFEPDRIEAVEVKGSLFTVRVQDLAEPYVDGPESPLAALNFTVPYNVAAALVDGEHTPRQLLPGRVRDESLWRLADRVGVVHDTDLTLSALASEIPVGAMLQKVGWKALPYAVKSLGLTSVVKHLPLFVNLLWGSDRVSLTGAQKNMGAEVIVRMDDGRSERHRCDRPPGFAGEGLDNIAERAETKLRDAVSAARTEGHLEDLPGADELVSFFTEMEGHDVAGFPGGFGTRT